MPSSRNLAKAQAFHNTNFQCAVLALRRPDRYPGVMQEWARMVLAKPLIVTEVSKIKNS